MRYYYDKPAAFIADVIGVEPDPWQAKAAAALLTHKFVSIKSGHGTGKCESANETILLTSGLYTRVGDLVDTQQEVLSFNQETSTIEKALASFSSNGLQPCVKLTTALGRERIVTYNHPFLTANKWIKAQDLKPGYRIATLNHIPINGAEHLPEEMVKIVAYLIGDGGLTTGSPVFTQAPNKQLEEFQQCVNALGCSLVPTGNLGYRVVNKNGENFVTTIMRTCGLGFSSSYDKFIPGDFFLLSNHLLSIFLSRLFSTDGWASVVNHGNKANIEVGFTSVSKQLVIDIQRMMLRFGILGKVSRRQTTWTHKGEMKVGHTWDWSIYDAKSILTFCSKIGIFGKEEALSKVQEYAQKRMTAKHSGPATRGPSLVDCGKRIRFFSQITGISTRYLPGRPGRTDLVSREYAHIAAKALGDTFLSSITHPHISWDEITKIEDAGELPTVMVSVPGNENYITDHIDHNSSIASWLDIWFLMTRPFCKVPCTAPTMHQLHNILWSNMSYWINQSELLKAALDWTQTKVAMRGYEATWFSVPRTARVDPKGRVSEGLQGFHAPHILIIVDEASGVDERVLSALEGAMTQKEAHILMIGNPTRLAGTFYKSHTTQKQLWYTDTVSCIDNPHVTKQWIELMRLKWGIESPEYQIKVLGEFPESIGTNCIIYRSIIEGALSDFTYTPEPDRRIIWGIDIARFGSARSCIAIREDETLADLIRMLPNTSIGTAAEIKVKFLLAQEKAAAPSEIRIDVGGGYGSNVLDMCRQDPVLSSICRPFNFGWAAKDSNSFINLRAEGYWCIKRKLEELKMKISPSCPYIDDLSEQLCDLRYTVTPKEKIQIEAKENFMSRNQNRSPDESDAVVMAFLDDWTEGAYGIEQPEPIGVYYHDINAALTRESFTKVIHRRSIASNSRWAVR